MQKKRVIIIGAGYGGIRALMHLHNCKEIEILLIERNSYHYLQTDVYDYIANQISLSDIAIDLYTFCSSFKENVSFIHEEVIRIDFANNKVITHTNRYMYDYLILATGAQTLMPNSIEGLKIIFMVSNHWKMLFFLSKSLSILSIRRLKRRENAPSIHTLTSLSREAVLVALR